MVSKPSSQFTTELYPIEAISGKWTVLIIYILSEKTMRHSELYRQLDGISQKVLTQTLRGLERDGIVKRVVYPVVPPQVEYSLTPLGRSLTPVLSEVCRWAKSHHREVAAARKRYTSSVVPS